MYEKPYKVSLASLQDIKSGTIYVKEIVTVVTCIGAKTAMRPLYVHQLNQSQLSS